MDTSLGNAQGPLTCITHIPAGQLNNKATAAFLKAVRNSNRTEKTIGIVKAFDLHNYMHDESPSEQDENSIMVIDCRTAAEFDAGHIEGALNYPMKFPAGNVTFTRIGKDPEGGPSGPLIGTGESESLQPNPKSLVLHYTKPSGIKQVVFYCSDDQIRSSALAFWFVQTSHAPCTQLLVLFGGLDGWQHAGGLVHVPEGAPVTPLESPAADESNGISQKNLFQRGMSLRRPKTRPRELPPFPSSLNQRQDQARKAPQDFSQSIPEHSITDGNEDSTTIADNKQDATARNQTVSETTADFPNDADANGSAVSGDASNTINSVDEHGVVSSPVLQSNDGDSDVNDGTHPSGEETGQVPHLQESGLGLSNSPSALSPTRNQPPLRPASPSYNHDKSSYRRSVSGMRRLMPLISVKDNPEAAPQGHQRQGLESSIDGSSQPNHIRGSGSLDLTDKTAKQDRFPLVPSNSLRRSGAVHVASPNLKSDKDIPKPVPSSDRRMALEQNQSVQGPGNISRKPLPSTVAATIDLPNQPMAVASDGGLDFDADVDPQSGVVNTSAVDQAPAPQEDSDEEKSGSNPDEANSIDTDKQNSTPATEDDNFSEHTGEEDDDEDSDSEFEEAPVPRATHKWYPGTEPEGHEMFSTNVNDEDQQEDVFLLSEDAKHEDESLLNENTTEDSDSDFEEAPVPRATHKWYPGTEPEGHEIFSTNVNDEDQQEEESLWSENAKHEDESLLNENTTEDSDSEFEEAPVPRATHKWYPGTEPEGHEMFSTNVNDEDQQEDDSLLNENATEDPDSEFEEAPVPRATHKWYPGTEPEGHEMFSTNVKYELDEEPLTNGVSNSGDALKEFVDEAIHDDASTQRGMPGGIREAHPDGLGQDEGHETSSVFKGEDSLRHHVKDKADHEGQDLEREISQPGGGKKMRKDAVNETSRVARIGPGDLSKLNPLDHKNWVEQEAEHGPQGNVSRGITSERGNEPERQERNQEKHEKHHNTDEGLQHEEHLLPEGVGKFTEGLKDKERETHEKLNAEDHVIGKIDGSDKVNEFEGESLLHEFNGDEKHDEDNGDDRGVEKEEDVEERKEESGEGGDEQRDEKHKHRHHHRDEESRESVQDEEKRKLGDAVDKCCHCGSKNGFGVGGTGAIRINAERVSGEMGTQGGSFFLLRLTGSGANENLSVWRFNV